LSSAEFIETADIETSSDDYARRFAGEIGAWFLKTQEQATLQLLEPYRGGSVVDVGGGHGQVTDALIRNGYRVTVVGSAEACKSRIQKFIDARSCSFQVGNILRLPYADRTFDAVVSYRLLPHVTRWETYLAELSRVATKAVIIDYPAVHSLNYVAPWLFHLKKRLEGNTRTFKCFTERELLNVFAAMSYKPAARFPQFFLPMVAHRIMNAPSLSSAMERCCRALGMTEYLGSPVILKFIRAE
jgi:ubiquinone/menaquinone biosynthesis C-methylase UbiE